MSAILRKLLEEMPRIKEEAAAQGITEQRDARLGFIQEAGVDPTTALQNAINDIAEQFGAQGVDYSEGRRYDKPHAVLYFKCPEPTRDAVLNLDDIITGLGGSLSRTLGLSLSGDENGNRKANRQYDSVNFNILLPVSIPEVKHEMVPKKILGVLPVGMKKVERRFFENGTAAIAATYSIKDGLAKLRVELRLFADPNYRNAADALAGLFGYQPAALAAKAENVKTLG